jgi:hypothetical protein
MTSSNSSLVEFLLQAAEMSEEQDKLANTSGTGLTKSERRLVGFHVHEDNMQLMVLGRSSSYSESSRRLRSSSILRGYLHLPPSVIRVDNQAALDSFTCHSRSTSPSYPTSRAAQCEGAYIKFPYRSCLAIKYACAGGHGCSRGQFRCLSWRFGVLA